MTRLFVPGRIEVLGKHTDYAGGRSLLAAVDRGFTVEAGPAADGAITVVDRGRDESVSLAVTAPGPAGEGEPDWGVYARAVVERVQHDFPGRLRDCRIELTSDLPPASGLSSSSALVTALFLALDAVAGISHDPRYRVAVPDRAALAGYLGAMERGSPFPGLEGTATGVGTRGGSEDHVAILCSEPGALVRYGFEPVRFEGAVPLPADCRFAVAVSGVRAEKTGAARARYNRLSDDATRVAELWRAATGRDDAHLGAILEAAEPADLLDAIRRTAPPDEGERLRSRVVHFAVESNELVPAGAEALAAGDLAAFDEIANRSQTLAEERLDNQVPETIELVRSANDLGASAASAFGAGFGGAVWALVPRAELDGFLTAWAARYAEAFPSRARDAAFFGTPAARPAHARSA